MDPIDRDERECEIRKYCELKLAYKAALKKQHEYEQAADEKRRAEKAAAEERINAPIQIYKALTGQVIFGVLIVVLAVVEAVFPASNPVASCHLLQALIGFAMMVMLASTVSIFFELDVLHPFTMATAKAVLSSKPIPAPDPAPTTITTVPAISATASTSVPDCKTD